MAVAVAVRGLTHVYPTPSGPLTVLDSVDLDVHERDIHVFIGPSGKTTLP